MKKVKFAVQIFILAAAFPVLFVSGITHHKKKTDHSDPQVKQTISIKEKATEKECYCEIGCNSYKLVIRRVTTKN